MSASRIAIRLGPPNDGSRPPLRERIRGLRYVPALLRLVWETHRGYTATVAVLRLIRSVLPLATLWIGKLIIDGVLAARAAQQSWRAVFGLVMLEIGLVIATELLARVSSYVDSQLGELFNNRVSVRLMQHAATLDLTQFEDPTFYDHLERARSGANSRVALISGLLEICQNLITLGTLSVALLAFSPWLMLLLAVAVLPSFVMETHFTTLRYALRFRRTPERRQLDYLRYVGASDETAKEVQLFGLAPWLIDRYRRLADQWYDENRRLSVKMLLLGSALSIFSTAGYYGAYLIIIAQTIGGTISIGSLTFLAASFARGRSLIQGLLGAANGIFEQSLYLRDLFKFFEMQPTIASQPNAQPVPVPMREGFVFDDVGFRYPGSERWAVRHVSFRLHPGERIALVGENGAGKTTLTKLLARLYDPTEGRILLDGVDLREYDLASLRRAIGVIFQDFVRYDMRFDENVGVGGIDDARSYLDAGDTFAPKLSRTEEAAAQRAPSVAAANGEPPPRMRQAAEKSLANSLLPRLPLGFRQMLGRRFEKGVELSGGEWQKVALARAYMRDAEVLILDEPTAALDARAEYEVFLRFAELMQGRTAVIISHRFSTVRMADRIVVLEQGQVVEDGTHEALIAHKGLYGELFAMQAAGYR